MGKMTVLVQEVTYVTKEVVIDLTGVDVDDHLLNNVSDVFTTNVYNGSINSVEDVLGELREGFGFDASIESSTPVGDVEYSIAVNDVF